MPRIDAETHKAILDDILAGSTSLADIARQHGVSYDKVRRIARSLGPSRPTIARDNTGNVRQRRCVSLDNDVIEAIDQDGRSISTIVNESVRRTLMRRKHNDQQTI